MKTMKQNVWVRMLSVLLSLTLICGLLPAINVWATDGDGWIQANNYTQLVKGVDYDYSFAVLGDIQHITDYTPGDLHYLFDYIINNKESKNIQFVFGMGDITNDVHNEANNLVEWQLAKEQHFRLSEAGIPYTVARGNHDNVTRMNTYFANSEDPSYMNQLDGFYQEGSVINAWKEFSAGGVDYLSIVINYESSDSVLEWASDVIEAHPNHRVIVTTHVYLAGQNDQVDDVENYDNEMNPSHAQSGTVNNAQQVWDKLISQHKNIFLVLSGHESSDDVQIQHKVGIHGNKVTEMRVDSQYTDLVYMLKDDNVRGGEENGVGMVTMMYFKNDGTQVAVEHYSTLRNMYRELKTFEVEAYEHYDWRYDSTDADSYNVDTYEPSTNLVGAPDIWQAGLGEYALKDLIAEKGLAYDGGGASILAANGMDLKNHSFALHSGKRTVEPSSTYTVSYKINGLSEATRIWPYIHYVKSELGGTDSYVSMTDSEYLRKGPINDWKSVSFDIVTDDKTSAIEIWLVTANGDVYIDDFSLVKKEVKENLLSEFEDSQNGVYLWNFTGGAYTSDKYSLSYLENGGADGSGAINVHVGGHPDPSKTGTLVGFRISSTGVTVKPSTRYELSYRIKLEEGMIAYPHVVEQKTSGTAYNSYHEAYTVTGSGEWQEVTAYFTTAADVTNTTPSIFVSAGTMVVDCFTLQEATGDKFINGNFEVGSTGWQGSGTYGNAGTWEIVKDAERNSQVMKLTATSADDSMSAMTIEDTAYYVFVKPNTQYTISYWLKMEGDGVHSEIRTRQKASDGTNGDRAWDVPATFKRDGATNGWVKVEEVYTSDNKAELLTIVLQAKNGTVYFDDLTISSKVNLIQNGSFEKGVNGEAPTGSGKMQGQGTYVKVDGAGVNSSAAVLITPQGDEEFFFRPYNAYLVLEPSTTYYCYYKFKADSGVTIQPFASQYSSLGNSWPRYNTVYGNGSGKWQSGFAEFTTDAGATSCEWNLIVKGGAAYIDDVVLIKKSDLYGYNFMTNGEFEEGIDSQLPTGFYTMQIGGKGKVEKVSGKGVNGSAAVHIEPRPSYILKTDDNNKITVSADTEYTLSYMVRVPSNVTEVYPIIRQYDNNGSALAELNFADEAVTNTDGWKEVTMKFTTDASTTQIAICLQTYGGRVDIDNLSVKGSNDAELVYNGNFTKGANADGSPIGFAGEFVQGVTQTGKVIYVSSARPNSIIFDVKAENGVLNAYSNTTLLGTVDEVYGKLEHKANFGVRISDADTANAVAEWVKERNVANLWVVSDNVELLSVVQSAKQAVRCVVDCTDKSDVNSINTGKFTRVLVSEAIGTNDNILTLQEKGLAVIVESATVSESLLTSGVDAILTTDALAAIRVLENITVSEVNKFAGATVTLGADFGVNFYLELSDNAEGMKVEFVVEGDKTSVDLTSKETNGYYLATVSIAAKDMTVPIVAKLLDAEGNVLCRYTYTMKEYAEYIIKNESYTDAQKTVAEAMLTYGGFAQGYFKYRDTELANVVYSSDMSNVDTSSITGMSKDGNAEGYIGASLMLKSKTAVRLNFNKSVEDAVQSGGRYYLEYDFDAKNLGTTRTEEINGTQYTFSVLSFAKAVIDGEYSESYQNLMKALVIYANAVQQLGSGN